MGYSRKNRRKSSVSDPDQHKDMPPGSGSEWTDTDPDPDPGGKKSLENIQVYSGNTELET